MEDLTTKVTEEDLNHGFNDKFGVVYSRDGKRLLKCENKDIRSYKNQDNTEFICDSAFRDCSYLDDIVIPNTVKFIGNYAFECCESLRHILIPNSLIEIGNNVFGSCTVLEELNLPDSILKLGWADWYDSLSLKQIRVPKNINKLYPCFYKNNKNLTKIIVAEGANFYSMGGRYLYYHLFYYPSELPDEDIENGIKDENGVVYNKTGDKLLRCENDDLQFYTVKDGTKMIRRFAFLNCKSLQNVQIPDSVQSIGEGAFMWCSKLQWVNIPRTVSVINEYTFAGCGFYDFFFTNPNIILKHDAIVHNNREIRRIVIPDGCKEKFKQMLPEELWEKLRYINKC